jgi:hypothetical protein
LATTAHYNIYTHTHIKIYNSEPDRLSIIITIWSWPMDYYCWFLSERRDRLTNCLLSVPGEHCRTSRASLYILYKCCCRQNSGLGGMTVEGYTIYYIRDLIYYYIVCKRLSIDQTNPSRSYAAKTRYLRSVE